MHDVTCKNACFGKEVRFGELFNYQMVADINIKKNLLSPLPSDVSAGAKIHYPRCITSVTEIGFCFCEM
jgi:hypothetical protein